MADAKADKIRSDGVEIGDNPDYINFKKDIKATATEDGGTDIDVTLYNEETGHYEFGSEIRQTDISWEDLKAPSTAINPVGLAAPPSRNATTGLLDFSASGTNTCAIAVQMPHAWKLESTISPHIHLWYPDGNAGNSVWKFEYQIAKIGTAFPGSYTSDTKTFAAPEIANQHVLHPFDDIDMTGIDGVSAMIVILLSRIGGDAADTYASALPLLEFDIHYQVDSLGSDEETSKG